MSKSIAPLVAVLLSVSVLSTSNAAIMVPTSLPDVGTEVTSDDTALVEPLCCEQHLRKKYARACLALADLRNQYPPTPQQRDDRRASRRRERNHQ